VGGGGVGFWGDGGPRAIRNPTEGPRQDQKPTKDGFLVGGRKTKKKSHKKWF